MRWGHAGQRAKDWVAWILWISGSLCCSSFPSSAQAAGVITGTVFQDFNSDGVFNTTSTAALPAVDVHVAGLTVSAYDASGTRRGTTTTVRCTGGGVPAVLCTGRDVGPNYSLTVTGTGPYRLEFTTLPLGFQPAAFGSNNNTSVQFVSDPAGGTTGGINFAINVPAEYCHNATTLATPCYVNGNPLTNSGSADDARVADVLVSFPYSAANTTPAPTHVANGAELGSVWGVAYQRETKKLFSAAVVKRHVGLGTYSADGSNGAGPLDITGGKNSGTGGIYVSDFSGGAPVTSTFIDVQALGINTGNFTAPRNLPANKTQPSIDAEAFALVGKAGIGDLDISDDGKTLWFTNLNNRTLYSIFINNPATTPTGINVTAYTAAPWLTTNPCTNGVARPWATKFSRGKVYIGVVCTAETGGTAANLRALVYAFDPTTASFATVLNFALNFTRGTAFNAIAASNVWYPWTDTYSDAAFNTSAAGCVNCQPSSRPMPILSDIEFDASGALIMGFIDRAGNQLGWYNQRPTDIPPPNAARAVIANVSGGDILRACPDGTGTYVVESNGSCGGVAGSGVGNGQGPTGGEYYGGETFGVFHNETSFGGLAQIPGFPDVVLSAMDPINASSGGLVWFSNANGSKTKGYELYNSGNTVPPAGTFGKAVGIGDIEALCNAAPLEIGNRVWRDDDRDGIQDPSEPAIAGVRVQLFKSRVLVGTAITDSNGAYYFVGGTAADADPNDHIGVVNGGILSNMTYEVRIDTTQAALTGMTLTTVNSADVGAPDGGSNADRRDSDGTLSGATALVSFTTGGAGENNHTFDFGFTPPPPTFSIGNRVWLDNGAGGGVTNDGIQNGTEPGIGGVVLKLFGCDGSGNPSGAVLQSKTTDGSGYYRFDGLAAGCYVVVIDVTASGVALTGVASSTGAIDTQTNITDRSDAGRDTPFSVVGALAVGILSGKVTVTSGTLPLTEADVFGAGQGAHGASGDSSDTLLVDFGFVPSAAGVGPVVGSVGGVASDPGTLPPVAGVPTLSEWSMAFLATLLVMLSWRRLRPVQKSDSEKELLL